MSGGRCPFRDKLRRHWPAAYRLLAPIGTEAIPMARAFHAVMDLEMDMNEALVDGIPRLLREFDDRIAAGTLPQDLTEIPPLRIRERS